MLILPFHRKSGQTSARAGGGEATGLRDQSRSEQVAESGIDSAPLIQTRDPNENTLDGVAR